MRIYSETVKKWAVTAGFTGFGIVFLTLMYLQAMGGIEVTGYSGDVVCAGTEANPCYAYVNFTATKDIYIYPMDYDPWGRNTPFNFSSGLKDWKLQRSWGSGWRTIDLNSTWNKNTKYAVKFTAGQSYELRIIGYKHNPFEDIKWGFGPIDPTWKGVKEKEFKHKTFNGMDVIARTDEPSITLHKWNRTAGVTVELKNVVDTPNTNLLSNKVSQDYDNITVNLYNKTKDLFEYEIILKQKPITNHMEFNVNSTDAVFYYQPPLYLEYGLTEPDATCNATDCGNFHRPVDVVGSYAVYSKSRRNNQYKTGKLFHIYRPEIIDASNESVWGVLDYSNEILTLTIPQEFLDKAKYPVLVDPGFGNAGTGGSNAYLQDNHLAGTYWTFPADLDTLDNCTFYGQSNFATRSGKPVIVLQSTKGIVTNGVGTAAVLSAASPQWTTLVFGTAPTVSASTDYYIMLVTNGDGFSYNTRYDTWTSHGLLDTGNSYASPSNPGGSTNNNNYCFYCNYTATAGGSTADGDACPGGDGDCLNGNCVEAIDEAVDYCAPVGKECSRDGHAAGYDTGDVYDPGATAYICKGDDLGGAGCASPTGQCDEYASYYCNGAGTWTSGDSGGVDAVCAICTVCGAGTGDLSCSADVAINTADAAECTGATGCESSDCLCDGSGNCDSDEGQSCGAAAECIYSNCRSEIDSAGDYCAATNKECSESSTDHQGYDTNDIGDNGNTDWICSAQDTSNQCTAPNECDEYGAHYCNGVATWTGGSSNGVDATCSVCLVCGGTASNDEGNLACDANVAAETADPDECTGSTGCAGTNCLCDGSAECIDYVPDLNYGLLSGITWMFTCDITSGTTDGAPTGQDGSAAIWCENNGTATGDFQVRIDSGGSQTAGWTMKIDDDDGVAGAVTISDAWQTFLAGVEASANDTTCAWFWVSCDAATSTTRPAAIEFQAVAP